MLLGYNLTDRKKTILLQNPTTLLNNVYYSY